MSGGLFGIDQEVVTLRGLYGNSGVLTDLRQADPILITGSVRAVALGAVLANSASKAPLRATALSLSHLTWSLCVSTTAF